MTQKPVAVITGAASGIGFALAQVCAQRGMHVVMADKDVSRLHQAVAQITRNGSASAIPCDVTQALDVDCLLNQTYEQCQRVDMLYNNVGIIGHLAPFWELSPEHIQEVMDVNLYGMIQVLQKFLPVLFKQDFRSHIINMASLFACCVGSQLTPYSMSKHAILALSETLHFELNYFQKPVDVSVVFPSFTDTGLLSNATAETDAFRHYLASCLSFAKPALDVAEYIVRAVENKQFYIFPDKEVSAYHQKRTEAMLQGTFPHQHSIESLLNSLMQRSKKQSSNIA
ncbi:MAG: SDR family oxidoreductase [Legionellaceae bacterium]|nr:SDR family oxidoreductase [Legionellaceae bacterium]